MNWQDLVITFIPFIMFAAILFLVVRRGVMKRRMTVHMVAAVKLDFPDQIEMKVSQDKREIDEWEMTFRKSGYRVSRRIDVIEISLIEQRRNLLSP